MKGVSSGLRSCSSHSMGALSSRTSKVRVDKIMTTLGNKRQKILEDQGG